MATKKRPPASKKKPVKVATKASVKSKSVKAVKSKSVTREKGPDEAELAALARKGNVRAIFKIADLESDSDNDRLAYKWLCAASDFGHAKADAEIDDILEVTSLRYDDDRYETASAHWELATAYLEGTGGLPLDLELAREHLEAAFELHDLDGLSDGTARKYSAKPLLGRLAPKSKKLLETMLAKAPLRGRADDDYDE